MKKLPIQSESFQYIEHSFREWLSILGYSKETIYQLPTYVRELFYHLEQHENIRDLNELTTPIIQSYYNQLKERSNQTRGGSLSNNSLNKHLQGLYRFMEYLRETGKIKLPYLEQEREEANSKPIEVLSQEEIQSLYKASEPAHKTRVTEIIGARDRAMLAIFYSCGLRRNEGVNLDLVDINFDRQLVHVRKGKGNKERFVPFNKSTSKVLEDYIYNYRSYFVNAKSLLSLFVSVKGNRMAGESLSLRLKVLQERSNNIGLQEKEISLHTLRHSIATHLLSAGMSLEKISSFLGHSSLESTQIYTHLV